MPTSKCASCGYSLEGLPLGGALFLSLAVQAVSWILLAIYADERHAPPLAVFLIIATPLTSTVLGAALGLWRARTTWPRAKGRGWRVAGLIVVSACFNVLLFAPVFILLLFLAAPSF
jgi:hypothetical protein